MMLYPKGLRLDVNVQAGMRVTNKNEKKLFVDFNFVKQ